MRLADVALCPTDSEGLPLVLLEAMASGKPVVASACPPYDSIVQHRVNGLVVPNEPEVFAEAIIRILEDPAFGNRLGQMGRQTAADYPWDLTVTRTAAFIESLAGRS
jgi:glycosyltransferase involved in cell wall biosynthesis